MARLSPCPLPGGVTCGLTIATENPAYVQGDYNANGNGNGFADPSVAAAVIADTLRYCPTTGTTSITFSYPFNAGAGASPTPQRLLPSGSRRRQGLIVPPFPDGTGAAVDGSQDFGTDGGVHNFMRFLENHNGTLNYQGSIVSLYFNRQAVGLYNSGGNNYSPPNRGYSFDSNFLNPLLLPPRTPMFRDINTTGFTQLLLPNQ